MKIAVMLSLALCLPMAVSLRAQQTDAHWPSACGPANVKFWSKAGTRSQNADAQPEAGKARIYFIHQLANGGGPWHNFGSSTYPVGLDGTWVGAGHDSSYFFVDVAPGEHHVCTLEQGLRLAGGGSLELIHLTVEPGKIYYVVTRVPVNGTAVGMFSLAQADSDMGQYLVDTLPPANWKRKD